jgi:hypothetical protein
MAQNKIDHCAVARRAIRYAFQTWGKAWLKIDSETRKAQLALEILELYTGHTLPDGPEWEEFRAKLWTAKDVWESLDCCRHWDSKYGYNMIRMADRDEKDPNDPIKLLEAWFRSIYG